MIHISPTFSQQPNRNLTQREREREDLKLGGLHGDGDADEEDTGHGDSGVAAPVLGPAVWATGHAPDLGTKVSMGLPMSVISSTSHWITLFL